MYHFSCFTFTSLLSFPPSLFTFENFLVSTLVYVFLFVFTRMYFHKYSTYERCQYVLLYKKGIHTNIINISSFTYGNLLTLALLMGTHSPYCMGTLRKRPSRAGSLNFSFHVCKTTCVIVRKGSARYFYVSIDLSMK